VGVRGVLRLLMHGMLRSSLLLLHEGLLL